MKKQQRKGEDLDRLNQGQHGKAEHVAEDDLGPPERARHQPFQRSLAAFAEEGHGRDDEDQEKHDQPDEGSPEVVEGVEIRAAVQIADLRLEAHPGRLAGKRGQRLADTLDDRPGQGRLGAFELDPEDDGVLLLDSVGEIGGEQHIAGNVAGTKLGFGVLPR